MVKYKCGHKTNGVIIIDDNELSILGWHIWQDTVGINGTREQCFECYCSQSKATKQKTDKACPTEKN